MQNIIRECVCILFTLIYLLKVRKSIKNKKQIFLSIFVLIALLLLVFLPFENLFLYFHSYETAFTYFSNKGTIACTMESDDSALVISFQNSNEKYLLLNKSEGLYSAPLQQPRLETSRNNDGNYFLFINEPGTNNYYTIIHGVAQQESVISDSCNSEFLSYSDLTGYFLCYVTYVQNVSDTYYVQIDDSKLYMN